MKSKFKFHSYVLCVYFIYQSVNASIINKTRPTAADIGKAEFESLEFSFNDQIETFSFYYGYGKKHTFKAKHLSKLPLLSRLLYEIYQLQIGRTYKGMIANSISSGRYRKYYYMPEPSSLLETRIQTAKHTYDDNYSWYIYKTFNSDKKLLAFTNLDRGLPHSTFLLPAFFNTSLEEQLSVLFSQSIVAISSFNPSFYKNVKAPNNNLHSLHISFHKFMKVPDLERVFHFEPKLYREFNKIFSNRWISVIAAIEIDSLSGKLEAFANEQNRLPLSFLLGEQAFSFSRSDEDKLVFSHDNYLTQGYVFEMLIKSPELDSIREFKDYAEDFKSIDSSLNQDIIDFIVNGNPSSINKNLSLCMDSHIRICLPKKLVDVNAEENEEIILNMFK